MYCILWNAHNIRFDTIHLKFITYFYISVYDGWNYHSSVLKTTITAYVTETKKSLQPLAVPG